MSYATRLALRQTPRTLYIPKPIRHGYNHEQSAGEGFGQAAVIAKTHLSWAYLILLLFTLSLDTMADEIPYPFNLPPGSRPVEVQARFFLSDINDINDQTETFEIKGLLALQWRDERYVFDPELEGVREKRYQGTFQFLEEYNGWWPQLVLSNGVGTIPLQSVALRISPDGTLLFIQEISAVVESPMDLRPYPFDKQRLKAIFEPLAFYATEVKLVTRGDMTDLPERSINVAGWELLGLSSEPHIEQDDNSDAEFTQLIVNLDMQRKSGYTIWFIIVPLSMIVLLSTSVFWMDRESLGDRMNISFVGLLTIVAYQFLVESSLPKIAYFTMINGFVYVGYITMIASIVANIWVENLNRRGEASVADRFDQMSRWAFPVGFLLLNLLSALYFYVV